MSAWPRSRSGRAATQPVAWNEIWGWAIPKGVPEERKQAAKEMLGAMLTDIDGQVKQWEETGGPPPSMEAWDVIAEQDPVFAKLKEVVFEADIPTHSAYYFPNWPAVHKAYSDVVIGGGHRRARGHPGGAQGRRADRARRRGRQLSAACRRVASDRPAVADVARTNRPGGTGPVAAAGVPGGWRLGERERFMLLLIAPAASVLILFQVVPILIGANASFRHWPLYDPSGEWLGLQHYIRVLTDPVFLGLVLPNTLLLMVSSVAISLVPRAWRSRIS